MTVLMHCAVKSLRAGATDMAFVQGLFTAIIREVTEAFKIEDDISVLITLVQSLTQVIEAVKSMINQVPVRMQEEIYCLVYLVISEN